MYNDRINGDYVDEDEDDNNGQDRDSDWSEDEQLGVTDYVEMPESKPKSKKKKKRKSKRKQREENEYDVSVNDVDSMPIHSGSGNDAIEVQIHSKENADYDQFYDQNETLRDEDLDEEEH